MKQNSSNSDHIVENLTCIVCPRSCVIIVERDKETGSIISLDNAMCKRGKVWAEQELLNPVRIVCSSVRVLGGEEPLTGVKTDRPVPKEKIIAIMKVIKASVMRAPVSTGDIVSVNPADTECRIIATRSVAAAEHEISDWSLP